MYDIKISACALHKSWWKMIILVLYTVDTFQWKICIRQRTDCGVFPLSKKLATYGHLNDHSWLMIHLELINNLHNYLTRIYVVIDSLRTWSGTVALTISINHKPIKSLLGTAVDLRCLLVLLNFDWWMKIQCGGVDSLFFILFYY